MQAPLCVKTKRLKRQDNRQLNKKSEVRSGI